MPQISVIVPVYKAELYLRRCVDSILAQTFQDLEVILIDDGSPDSCGAICDEYAKKDARVRVIHKENGGVSSARNAGVRAARGAYLSFVDSDDYIAPDMEEALLRALRENDCDLAVCQYYLVQGEKVRRRTSGDRETRVLDRKEALRLLIGDRLFTNHLWRMLYKKELFSGIEFPEGRAYEDISVMAELMLHCRRVVYLDQAYYYYYKNKTGIVATKTIDNLTDNLDAIQHQGEVVKGAYPELMPAWYASLIKKIMILLGDLLTLPPETAGRNALLRRVLDVLAAIPPAARKGFTRKEIFCCWAARFPNAAFLFLWPRFLSLRRLFGKLRRKAVTIMRRSRKA